MMNMDRALNITTVAFLLALVPITTASATEPEVGIQRISERVIVLNVPASQSTNVVAVQSAAGIVVVDSEVSPTFAAAIRKRITEEFESDIFYCLINTHGHGDHTAGNQVFDDVPIIGHDNVAPSMVGGEARLRATGARLAVVVSDMEKRLASTDPDSEQAAALRDRINYYNLMREGLGGDFTLTPPSIVFNDAMTLHLGDMTLELTWFGTAHSESDILIFCPEENVLLTGDLFAPGADLYVDSQRITQIPRWITQLETVTSKPEVPVAIVPGHGDLLSMAEIDHALERSLQQRDLYAGRESAFLSVQELWDAGDIDAGLARLRDLQTHPETYYLIHSELDAYGFKLMMDGAVDEALSIFTVLADLFPENDVAFDSLGEAYLRKDDSELAARSFQRALELNPDNRNAAAQLQSLEGK